MKIWFLKSEKERLLELLEWFLSHDWRFGKDDFSKLSKLNTLLLRFDYEPIWIKGSLYDSMYIYDDSGIRQEKLKIYKELRGKK